jgi:hypothetical protein
MRLLCFLLLCGSMAAAQQPAASDRPSDPQQLVTREFGPGIIADLKTPALFGDLDGDGQEDAVIVAKAKSPLANEVDFHYVAIDPYDAYFGFGDAKVTVQFSATNATDTRYVLVIHHWRAPKAKFLILNLPFQTLSLGRISLKKKKSLASIHADEPSGLSSDVYWNGKKYKWEPGYFNE